MPVLVLASQNEKKLKELKAILTDLPFEILLPGQIGVPPKVEEDGNTFEENAVKKALAIAAWSGKLSLADDSGLCVDALDGAPGVYSARFAGPEQNDLNNNLKLLSLLENVPGEKRKASFKCVIAIAEPGRLIGVASGEFPGSIALDRKGAGGFGYDPVFIDLRTGKRFAELSAEEKNRISHRARALQEAKKILDQLLLRR